MAIYNLTGKADIWWQDLKRVKGIEEKSINLSTFKKYFKRSFYRNSIMKSEVKNSIN